MKYKKIDTDTLYANIKSVIKERNLYFGLFCIYSRQDILNKLRGEIYSTHDTVKILVVELLLFVAVFLNNIHMYARIKIETLLIAGYESDSLILKISGRIIPYSYHDNQSIRLASDQ